MLELLASLTLSRAAVDIRELSAYRAREVISWYFGRETDAAIGQMTDRQLTSELERICGNLDQIRQRSPNISLLEEFAVNSDCWVDNPLWEYRR